MSNTINPNNVPTTSTPSTTSDGGVHRTSELDDVSGATGIRRAQIANTTTQDAYATNIQGVRGNVLSTPPPVPSDAGTSSPVNLRTAQGRLSYMGEGQPVARQALALSAENPAIKTSAQPAGATLGSAAPATSSASSSDPNQSSSTGSYTGSSKAGPAEDKTKSTADATKTSQKWVKDLGGGKCNRIKVDKDMAKATGLPEKQAKQAFDLMKKDKNDYGQQIGTAMAVLAQEKSAKSPSYEADKEKITAALQQMTDNVDKRGKGNPNSETSVNAFNDGLRALSGVVTGRLGTDPTGSPPARSGFNPATARSVNSY